MREITRLRERENLKKVKRNSNKTKTDEIMEIRPSMEPESGEFKLKIKSPRLNKYFTDFRDLVEDSEINDHILKITKGTGQIIDLNIDIKTIG